MELEYTQADAADSEFAKGRRWDVQAGCGARFPDHFDGAVGFRERRERRGFGSGECADVPGFTSRSNEWWILRGLADTY